MRNLLKITVAVLIPAALLAMLALLYAATFYAINKSHARTACYRAATIARNYDADCGKPDAIERVMRWLNGR